MSTIRLGGVKVIENRAYLCSSCRSGDALGSICSVLAAGRVNLGLLTYMADTVPGESITAVCARSDGSFSGYILGNAGRGECRTAEIEKDVSRILLFRTIKGLRWQPHYSRCSKQTQSNHTGLPVHLRPLRLSFRPRISISRWKGCLMLSPLLPGDLIANGRLPAGWTNNSTARCGAHTTKK